MRHLSNIQLVLLVPAVVLLSSAQAQGGTQQVEALQEEVARLQAQVESLSSAVVAPTLLIANSYLAAAGFDAMDEALQAGELDPRWLETVRTTLTAVNAVAWPDELREGVAAFTDAAVGLEAALQEEDLDAAAEAASEAHERQHDLSLAIFAHLAPHDASGAHGNADGGDGPDEEAQTEVPEDAERFVLEIGENGGAVGGAATYRVRRGDTVAFTLRSATPGGLDLHGYGLDWDLGGDDVTAVFSADATGRFPLEFHPTGADGVVVGYLEVLP